MNLDIFKESFANDLKNLSFNGTTVTGKNGLVSVNLESAKLMVRKRRGKKPFCYLNLPTKKEEAETLPKVLMNPKLRGMRFDTMDDLTSTLWAFVNIRLADHPFDFRQMELSPEAADLLNKTFPF